ncbi:hypothetical protein TNCT_489961 [Trichonephila clavata]|uniref:Uncharacterized protein n=1 Tax=Trichonephila clavata TaxID=2740835 RepID=A0A8X6H3U4_TRICU|nr:hypothetical protein TNCT_489961 [Trichonephila clavata]
MGHKVYRATYPPGMMSPGDRSFYRGEFLLQRKYKESVSLRSGLPTFSRHQTFLSTFDHVVVTPKFDGSLVNILFIPLQHPIINCFRRGFMEIGMNLDSFGGIETKNSSWIPISVKKFNTVMGSKTFDTFISSYDSYFERSRLPQEVAF